jgi:hypothetical protein
MNFTTSVDRCEERSDITRVFLRDGFSFDLPMLVMRKEQKIMSKTLNTISSGVRIQYQITFGITPPSPLPDGDLVIQGTLLHMDDSVVIGSAGGLMVRFGNLPRREREFTDPDTVFRIVLNFL